MSPLFGAGSTLGPFGNAGPSGVTSDASGFAPNFGTVYWKGGGPGETVQNIVPVIVVAAVALGALWLIKH